ncbi:MAG: glycosyltransferase family 39 protein [Lachnospiraceae bacterium]|nr:glycosyltransferase family 39 protein [Lachnospiraceae bacterium]
MNVVKKLNKKIENISKMQEIALVVLLSALMVFGIIVGIGTITSGYHLVDDHEFLEWIYQMQNQGKSVWELIVKQMRQDIVWRYEPAYYATRILSVRLFGVSLTGYSLVKAIEITVSCVFLYYCGRRMGAAKVYSFLFAALSLVGYQSAVWWKLGPQESQCTMFFAMGFYCMLRFLDNNRKCWAFLSIVLFFIMSNFKESFILLIPFLMMYVLYSELEKDETRLTWSKIWKCIRNRFWYLLTLGLIFLALVFIIVVFVGVNDYDMVGLDASIPLKVYIEALQDSFVNDLKWYKRFGILFVLILLTYWEDLKKLWKEMLLIVSFLLPQLIIFGQTGLGERYILPSSIGAALFFVIIIPKWKPLSGKRRMVYVLGLWLLLAAHGRVALREADYFRYRGQSVNTMLETVLELSDENTKVLSCFRPNEEGNLTLNYWMLVHGYDNVYFWTENDEVINRVCDINIHYPDENYEEQSFGDIDIAVMYNQEDRHWCYTPSLDLADFIEMKCGTLTLYIRKDSGITPVDIEIEGLRINF